MSERIDNEVALAHFVLGCCDLQSAVEIFIKIDSEPHGLDGGFLCEAAGEAFASAAGVPAHGSA